MRRNLYNKYINMISPFELFLLEKISNKNITLNKSDIVEIDKILDYINDKNILWNDVNVGFYTRKMDILTSKIINTLKIDLSDINIISRDDIINALIISYIDSVEDIFETREVLKLMRNNLLEEEYKLKDLYIGVNDDEIVSYPLFAIDYIQSLKENNGYVEKDKNIILYKNGIIYDNFDVTNKEMIKKI